MTSKHEKFVELAEKRVARAVKDIDLIGNLANTSNYHFSEAEAQEVLRALEAAMKRTKNRFTDALTRQVTFTLRK